MKPIEEMSETERKELEARLRDAFAAHRAFVKGDMRGVERALVRAAFDDFKEHLK